jgi:hypothetical protein
MTVPLQGKALRMVDERGEHKAESDVDPDFQRADSRDTGGVPNEDADDQGSTTGSTPSGEYVGRIAGQDVGYAGETGAEARAEQARRDR